MKDVAIESVAKELIVKDEELAIGLDRLCRDLQYIIRDLRLFGRQNGFAV